MGGAFHNNGAAGPLRKRNVHNVQNDNAEHLEGSGQLISVNRVVFVKLLVMKAMQIWRLR